MAYDPYISVNAAWQLSRNVKRAMTMEEIFRECDYITVHVPLTEETKGILNRDSFEIMKENVHILNFSRGELVVEDDLEIALKEGKIRNVYNRFPNRSDFTNGRCYCVTTFRCFYERS